MQNSYGKTTSLILKTIATVIITVVISVSLSGCFLLRKSSPNKAELPMPSHSSGQSKTDSSGTSSGAVVEKEMDEKAATDIVTELIGRYEQYISDGAACDFDTASASVEEREILTNLLSEDEKYFTYYKKCLCCKTQAELVKHAEQYFDKSLIDDEFLTTVSYNNYLYVISYGKGNGGVYKDLRIKSFNGNEIIATLGWYDRRENDGIPRDFYGTYKFTVVKKGDRFVIQKIENFGVPESKPTVNPLTKEKAKELINAFHKYRFFSTCCEITEAPQSAEKDLTQYQIDNMMIYPYKITCCKNVAEAKAHAEKYISQQWLDKEGNFDTRAFFGHNGDLYVAVVPMGINSYDYDALSLAEKGNNVYVASVPIVDIDGYCGAQTFTIGYENGAYKVQGY